MYLPLTWVFYFFPLSFGFNFVLKFCVIHFTLFIFSKIIKSEAVCQSLRSLKITGLSFLSDFFGLCVFFIGCNFFNVNELIGAPSNVTLNELLFMYGSFSLSFAAAFLLIYFFGFKKAGLSKKQHFVISLITTIFTAPVFFLMLY